MLHAIIGTMGIGKTLSMTYLGYKKYSQTNCQIYSNYELNKDFFPNYKLVTSLNEVMDMKNGLALLDELWLTIDSRESHSSRNRLVSKILAKSRKVGITILYTVQHPFQIDKRIRQNTHSVFIPHLTFNKRTNLAELCTLTEYNGYKFYEMGIMEKMRVKKFRTKYVFMMYDTLEEITAFGMEETHCCVCDKKKQSMFYVKEKLVCNGCKKIIISS